MRGIRGKDITMVDLLLINSPIQEYSKDNRPKYSTTAPLGLGYLATIASQAGYSVKIIDAEAEKLSTEEIIKKANSLKPKSVGINVFSTNYKRALSILNKIKSPYKIVGGPHATLIKEKLKSKKYVLIIGEAESVILDILKNKPSGIVYGGVVENLDPLPFIDRSFFKNDPYALEGKKEASVISTRGCIFNCVFCSNPIIGGRRVRTRSINNILKEIKLLKKSGVNSIHFVDDIFNYDKKRLENFCNALIKEKIKIKWRALCRTDNLNIKILKKMKKSGCYKLAFGVESGTPRILRYIGKNFDLSKVEKVFKICRTLRIETKAFFTIGYPSETIKEIQNTIDFALKLNPNEIRFMVVRAFPGTKLYRDMKKSGMTEKQLDSYHQFKGKEFYIKYHVMNIQSLNKMSPQELNSYINQAYSKFNKKGN